MKISTTCNLVQSFVNFSCNDSKYSNVQLPFAYHHRRYPSCSLLPASSKMPQRGFCSQQKRQEVRKCFILMEEQENPINGDDDEQHSESEGDIGADLMEDITTTISQHEDLHDIIVTPLQVKSRDGREKFSRLEDRLEDLIDKIRNVEKNALLINEARIRALEDLKKIVNEREALQEQMNILEMKLAKFESATEDKVV